MSERDPQRWARFAMSVLALLAVVVAAPLGLSAVARSRFGSANPLAGADPPWRWGSDGVGDALSGPIADDTVIDGIIRLSLCVVWVALAVIVVTTVVEVIHAVRHQGLGLPDVRGLGWAQWIARFIAVGLVAVLPMMTSSTSLASTLDARTIAAAPIDVASAPVPHAATAASPAASSHVVTNRVARRRCWPGPRGGGGRVDLLDRRRSGRQRLVAGAGDRRRDHRRQPRHGDAGRPALHQPCLRRGRLDAAAPDRRGRPSAARTRRADHRTRTRRDGVHRRARATRCGTSPTNNSATRWRGRRSGSATPATTWAVAAHSTTRT